MKANKLIIAAWAILLSLAYLFNVGGDKYFPLVSWGITFICIGFSLYHGLKSLKFFGTDSLQGKSVLFFLATLALWLIGDVMNFLFLKESMVSLADFFFIISYIPFSISIFLGIRTISPNFLITRKAKLIAAVISALIIFGYLFFFPLSWNPVISLNENLVSSGYVICDAIMAVLVLGLAISVFSGTISKAWLIIGVGILSTLVGDVLFSLNYATYDWFGNNLIDLSYYFGYLLYATGFIFMREVFEIPTHGATKAKTKRKTGRK